VENYINLPMDGSLFAIPYKKKPKNKKVPLENNEIVVLVLVRGAVEPVRGISYKKDRGARRKF